MVSYNITSNHKLLFPYPPSSGYAYRTPHVVRYNMGRSIEYKDNKVRVALNKILRMILRVKTDNFHVPLLGCNEMYVMLELLKFDGILDYCLIKFINWCFTARFDMLISFSPSDNRYRLGQLTGESG